MNPSHHDDEPVEPGETHESDESGGPPPDPSRSRVPLLAGASLLAVLLLAGGIATITFLGGERAAAPSPKEATDSATASQSQPETISDPTTAVESSTGSPAETPSPAGTDPAGAPATLSPSGLDETNAIWTEEPAAWTPLPNSGWSCPGITGNRYMSPSTNCLYNVADGHDAFYGTGMYADAIGADPNDLPTLATLVVTDWIETNCSDAHDLAVTDLTGEWTNLDGEPAALATGRAVWADTSPYPYAYTDVVVLMYELAPGRFFIGIGSAPEPYPGGLAELEHSLLATEFA